MPSGPLRDPSKEAQLSDDALSVAAREPLGDARGLASDASRATKLGKHDRPLSQTSHRGSGGNSDTARPQRRLVCCIVLAWWNSGSQRLARNPPEKWHHSRLNIG